MRGAGAGARFGQGAGCRCWGRIQAGCWAGFKLAGPIATSSCSQQLSRRKHNPGNILIPGQTKGPDLQAASRKAILHLKG